MVRRIVHNWKQVQKKKLLLLLPKKLYVQFFIKGCHENIFSPSYQESDVVFAAKVNSPSIGRELCGKKNATDSTAKSPEFR